MDGLFFYIVISGLIVALIMNTAAAGVAVRLRFSPKHRRCLTFVSSAHNYLNIPQGSSGGHIVVGRSQIRTILSQQSTFGRRGHWRVLF